MFQISYVSLLQTNCCNSNSNQTWVIGYISIGNLNSYTDELVYSDELANKTFK